MPSQSCCGLEANPIGQAGADCDLHVCPLPAAEQISKELASATKVAEEQESLSTTLAQVAREEAEEAEDLSKVGRRQDGAGRRGALGW